MNSSRTGQQQASPTKTFVTEKTFLPTMVEIPVSQTQNIKNQLINVAERKLLQNISR